MRIKKEKQIGILIFNTLHYLILNRNIEILFF